MLQTLDGPLEASVYPLSPALSEEEARVYADLRIAPENPDHLLRAALSASGAEGERLARLERHTRQAFERLLPALRRQPDAAQRGRVLLVELHATLLRTYVLDQSYLDVALETGVYNCVTAAVLYNVFAGWAGLRAGAALVPSHPHSWVEVGGRALLVEPTDPAGFDFDLSPEPYRVFLAQRRLEAEEKVAPVLVPSHHLVARILADRLVHGHEAAEAVGTGPQAMEDRLGQVALAVGNRLLALQGGDALALRGPLLRLEKTAAALAKSGRDRDAFTLQRIAVALLGPQGEDARRVRHNLAWLTGVYAQGQLKAGRVDEALQAVGEARQALRCDEPARDAEGCRTVEENARKALWNGSIDLAGAGRADLAWRAAEAISRALPDSGDPVRLIHFARAETDRLWATGNRAAAEAFVGSLLDRFDCDSAGGPGCAEMANRLVVHWNRLDTTRVYQWARLAHRYAPEIAQMKENLRAAGIAEMERALLRQRCPEVVEIGGVLREAGLLDEPGAELLSRCGQ